MSKVDSLRIHKNKTVGFSSTVDKKKCSKLLYVLGQIDLSSC